MDKRNMGKFIRGVKYLCGVHAMTLHYQIITILYCVHACSYAHERTLHYFIKKIIILI